MALGGVIALIIGLGAGTADAFWTSSGSGTSSVSTGTLLPVTLVALADADTPTSDLQPGGTGDLVFNLDNDNSYPVTLVGVSQDGPVTVVGGDGCTSDAGQGPSVSPGNSGVSVPPRSELNLKIVSGSEVVHIPNGAAMSSLSINGCQGATFEIPITISVQK